ncbi:hypothetical protein NBH00_21015 [Paraconexibacter antarcticus]|uniref:Uncharacterized protein n=1 Tax=Paraconexibacter antarcticus TaxID=2949664 RepID=A0ABY5DSL6_9ACTN|nr:hypothetical protein [Paraconexibacter antarcticus]UTI63812.1 hypothetical protein NBH00_21015 [Paraconexibacter antarcticus]
MNTYLRASRSLTSPRVKPATAISIATRRAPSEIGAALSSAGSVSGAAVAPASADGSVGR